MSVLYILKLYAYIYLYIYKRSSVPCISNIEKSMTYCFEEKIFILKILYAHNLIKMFRRCLFILSKR